MNAWAAWEQDPLNGEDGVIHLINQNDDGLIDWYEEVDYLILEDIVFGANGEDADLVIDADVTVWFSLEPTDQEEVDDDQYTGSGEVVSACTFTFNAGATFTCGAAGIPVILEPCPFLMDFLDDYDDYPVNLPGVVAENGFWAESHTSTNLHKSALL